MNNYIVDKDLVWIWIFDQYNALYNHNVLYEYPFTLVKSLAGFLKDHGIIVVSASANNEDYPKGFKRWEQLPLYGGYNDKELNKWYTLNSYSINDPTTMVQLDEVKF